MNRKYLIVLAIVGLLSACGSSGDDEDTSVDSDGDGVFDNVDAFPNDASETVDSDDDGVGDNGDAFPNDASETVDSDDDGVGDNGDAFPNDATETLDSDDDGVGDNADAFPNDASKTTAAADTIILPSETGIELQDWYLSIPDNEQGKTNDKNDDGVYSPSADSISISSLVAGYTHEYFYGIEEADGDKGIVMKSPPRGPTTSENTYYARVELRELLGRGSVSSNSDIRNNWVFSSAPSSAQNEAAGIDGELNVTMAVNYVTTTYGEDLSQVKESDQSKSKSQFEFQVGRAVIGQIHASGDEPIRLYYRKLPEHTKGSIYFYHEPAVDNTDEILVEMIGTKDLDTEPSDGIALDEKFSYNITVTGNTLSVTISRDGKDDVTRTLDMSDSAFDTEDEWHYFKVGLYHLNNTAADGDYVQATFYEIRNSHTNYAASE